MPAFLFAEASPRMNENPSKGLEREVSHVAHVEKGPEPENDPGVS
jgi:hypothetical protein